MYNLHESFIRIVRANVKCFRFELCLAGERRSIPPQGLRMEMPILGTIFFSLVKTSRYAEQILPLCFNMQNDLYMYAFMCIKQFNISRKKDSTGKEWLDHSHIPQPVIYIIDSPR